MVEKVVAEALGLYHGSRTRHSTVGIQQSLLESRQWAMRERLCQNQSTTASVPSEHRVGYQR